MDLQPVSAVQPFPGLTAGPSSPCIAPEAKGILDDWAVEQITVNGLHGQRNQLAHWTAERIIKPDGREKARLKPPLYSPKTGNVWQTDIEHWEKQFFEANVRLSRLAERLAGHKGLQRKFVEQVASQIECCLPDDRSLLEYLRQRLSEHLKP